MGENSHTIVRRQTPGVSTPEMVVTVPTDQPDGPPAYAQPMLQTVEEVWREWMAGVNGGPAISRLEERWGASWRRSGQQAQWFSRRKVVGQGEGVDQPRTQ